MNHRNSVITALKMFSDSYPGKFSVGNNVGTWERVLFGIDPDVIPIAALHIVSTRKDWPPDPATMREQCINMSHGQLSDPTGSEAWERILEKINRPGIGPEIDKLKGVLSDGNQENTGAWSRSKRNRLGSKMPVFGGSHAVSTGHRG